MEDVKAFNIRIPREMHNFLRKLSYDTHIPMNSLIIESLKKFMKNHDKKIDGQ